MPGRRPEPARGYESSGRAAFRPRCASDRDAVGSRPRSDATAAIDTAPARPITRAAGRARDRLGTSAQAAEWNSDRDPGRPAGGSLGSGEPTSQEALRSRTRRSCRPSLSVPLRPTAHQPGARRACEPAPASRASPDQNAPALDVEPRPEERAPRGTSPAGPPRRRQRAA
jgi:hypothetical protein